MEQNAKKQSMILVAVNQGYTEAVMATAKAAGARGGTVIRSHILRSEEHDSFGGPTFAGERELLVIVASSQGERNAIMESIDKAHGGESAAHAHRADGAHFLKQNDQGGTKTVPPFPVFPPSAAASRRKIPFSCELLPKGLHPIC